MEPGRSSGGQRLNAVTGRCREAAGGAVAGRGRQPGATGRRPRRGASGGGGSAAKAATGGGARIGDGETKVGLSAGAGRWWPAGSRGGRRPVEALSAGAGGCSSSGPESTRSRRGAGGATGGGCRGLRKLPGARG
ncbi:uncharacterized protein LOC131874404 [Cryptomeria japonica]|uniref:uncharacterized protein LOC131874404 n=1 Tax=Cryptomeria japonica TaxID=3369 RepID=UPI0027DA36A7|nr:uncharacterized protein LOC131874404 [Cryptomeria japonica]